MRLTLATGQTLAVDSYGDETMPALILLHGLSGNRRTYDDVVEHLLPRYVGPGQLHLLVVDQRGHGHSSRAGPDGYDAVSYAQDLAALIETLGPGGPPAIVVGHSLGGVVGAALARARPELVRGLFLEDPPLFEGEARRREASPAARFFPALITAVRQFQARDAAPEEYRTLVTATSPPDEVEERCQALHQWDPATMEAAVSGVLWRGFDPDAPLPCPVTVLRADPTVGAVFEPADAERFAAANPEAEVVMVPDAGHSIHATATLAPYLSQLHLFLTNL